MKLYTLNIGLGDSAYGLATMDWPRRLKVALHWLSNLPDCKGVRLVRPGEGASEPTLVARIVEDPARCQGLYADLTNLCASIEQDCVAIAGTPVEGVPRGYLIGPHAEKYQPFDPAEFITWEQA